MIKALEEKNEGLFNYTDNEELTCSKQSRANRWPSLLAGNQQNSADEQQQYVR